VYYVVLPRFFKAASGRRPFYLEVSQMSKRRKEIVELLRNLLMRNFATEAECTAEFCRLAERSRASYYRYLEIVLKGE
jgi:hypothetical protein